MADPVLTSIAAGVIANFCTKAIAPLTDSSITEVRLRIKNALASNALPPNRVMERAILRSAVLATHLCFDDTVAEEMRPKMDGAIQAAWTGGDFARGAPAARANDWLTKTSRYLAHNYYREKKRQATIDALMSSLNISSDDVLRDAEVSAKKGIAGIETDIETESSEIQALKRLSNQMIAQVARIGRWSDLSYAINRLAIACEHKSEESGLTRWEYAFSHYYAQELKDDKSLQAIVSIISAEVREADQRAFRERVESVLAEMKDSIEATKKENEPYITRGMDRWVMETMFQQKQDRIEQDGDLFHFAAEYDEFIGRDSQMKSVEQALFGQPAKRFQWMAICGDGGTGKSRLSAEIIDRAYEHGYANAGFVSHAFIKDATFMARAADQIAQDTLMVVDYSTTSTTDELNDFLENCVRFASDETDGSRLRLIVIFRNPEDPFFKRLEDIPTGKNGPTIRKSEVRFGEGRFTLGQLSQDDTYKLMQDRIEKVAKETDTEMVIRTDLLNRLRDFDSLMRPLFALLVADSIQRGELDKIQVSHAGESAKMELFISHLKRQRREYWLPRVSNEISGHTDTNAKAEVIDRHSNVARLATSLMGLELGDYRKIRSRSPDLEFVLPYRPRHGEGGDDMLKSTVIRTICGKSIKQVGVPDKIPPLEPDLIGECFVLKGDAIFARTGTALEPKDIIEIAYSHNPDRALQFLRMMIQDYPSTMLELDFLLPPINWDASQDEIEAEHVRRSAFVRNICADVSRRADTEFRTDLEMRLLRRLMMFTEQLVEFDLENDKFQANIAITLKGISLLVANAINTNIDIGEGVKPAEVNFKRQNQSALRNIFWVESGSHAQASVSSEVLDRRILEIADNLARRLFGLASAKVFLPQPFESALAFVSTLKNCLGSIFWEGRNDPERGGRHSEDLGSDRSSRNEFMATLMDSLKASKTPEERAFSASLLGSIIYAVHGPKSAVQIKYEISQSIIKYAYADEQIQSLTHWPLFEMNLATLHNVALSLQDQNGRLDDTDIEKILHAQGRLIDRGAKMFERSVLNTDIANEELKGAGSTFAKAGYALSQYFGTQPHRETLIQNWSRIARLLTRHIDMFEVTVNLLWFFQLPFRKQFEKEISNSAEAQHVIGTKLSNALTHLQPVLDANGIDLYGIRHEHRALFQFCLVSYVVFNPAARTNILLFANTLEKQVGCTFIEDICKAIVSEFGIPKANADMLLDWLLSDDRILGSLQIDDAFAKGVFSLWSNLVFVDASERVYTDIERCWLCSENLKDTTQGFLHKALALRGLSLLVSYHGVLDDKTSQFVARLRLLISAGSVDYGLEAKMTAIERNARAVFEDAIVEAVLSIAMITLDRNTSVDQWITGEEWAMNFKSAAELEARLAEAIFGRMTAQTDWDEKLRDLDRIRRLSARNKNLMQHPLAWVLENLPAEHEEYGALSDEYEALLRHTQSQSSPAADELLDLIETVYRDEPPTGTSQDEVLTVLKKIESIRQKGTVDEGDVKAVTQLIDPSAHDELNSKISKIIESKNAPNVILSDQSVERRFEVLSSDRRQKLIRSLEGGTEWHLPESYPASWRELSKEETVQVIETIVASYQANHNRLAEDLLNGKRVRQVALPFYTDHILVEILIEDDAGKRSVNIVIGPEYLHWLTGESATIHALNASTKQKISTIDSASAYLDFFCAYVHADEGPFTTFNNLQQLETYLCAGESFSAQELIDLDDAFEKVTVGIDDRIGVRDDAYLTRAIKLVKYGNLIYLADFRIVAGGEVTMNDDEPLMEVSKMKSERIVRGWRVLIDDRSALH